jgi:hypothetical protein
LLEAFTEDLDDVLRLIPAFCAFTVRGLLSGCNARGQGCRTQQRTRTKCPTRDAANASA